MPERRSHARLLLQAAVLCLSALPLAGSPSPASAQSWTSGPCEDPDGITVVVDFAAFRDEVVVRCAPAPVESGYDALTKVGLEYTPTQRFPGFLCRIEGLPADDPCANTPPPDAYWGYWRAERGGGWTYSQHGPATTNPPPGPVEGWAFSTGDDTPPREAPPPPARPEPSPTHSSPTPDATPSPTSGPTADPTPTAPPGPTAPPSEDPSGTGGTAGDPSTPTPTTATTPTAAETSPTPDPAATATPSPSPDVPASSSREAGPIATSEHVTTAAAPAADGPPLGTLAGVVLVTAVGGGALVVDRRRRRS